MISHPGAGMQRQDAVLVFQKDGTFGRRPVGQSVMGCLVPLPGGFSGFVQGQGCPEHPGRAGVHRRFGQPARPHRLYQLAGGIHPGIGHFQVGTGPHPLHMVIGTAQSVMTRPL